MPDLHEVPKFEDRWSHLYLDCGRLDCDASSLAFVTEEGRSRIPIDQVSVLFLGPGSRISAAAVKLLARNNCLVCWTGRDGQRMYAHATGGTHSSHRLLRQAQLFCDHKQRLAVIRRMLAKRFDEPLPDNLTLQQMRGREGYRVRAIYKAVSERTGVPWSGRNYDQSNWDHADPVNRALSAANALLYGLCHAAILSAGYSPAIGFLHTGKMLSFVYDVADFYKTETTIPLAFEVVQQGREHVEKRIRLATRRAFFAANLMNRILPDIAEVLDAPDDLQERPNELEGRAVSLADRTRRRDLRGQSE
jgi:CRISP-associated protein Cas1